MRPCSLLISILLVLHLLLCGVVYGARPLHNKSDMMKSADDAQPTNLVTSDVTKKDESNSNKKDVHNDIDQKDEAPCKDDEEEHCFQTKGANRNVVVTPPTSMAPLPSTSQPLQKKMEKQGNNNYKLSLERKGDKVRILSLLADHEDVMAMTEMDYSSARRKPPIHN